MGKAVLHKHHESSLEAAPNEPLLLLSQLPGTRFGVAGGWFLLPAEPPAH